MFERTRRVLRTVFGKSRPPEGDLAPPDRDPSARCIGQVQANPDPILAAQAITLDQYAKLFTNPHVLTHLQSRRLAVAGRPWSIVPASDDERDKQVAEVAKGHFQPLSLMRVFFMMLEALVYGFSVVEIVWDTTGELVTVAALKPRKAHRFVFGKTGELRLLTNTSAFDGEELPERKFLVLEHPPEADNPYGAGLGRVLWFLDMFWRGNYQYWNQHNERFASPSVKGEHPPGASEQQRDDLLRACQAVQSGSSVTYPTGQTLDLMEPTESNWQSYPSLLDNIGRLFAMVIHGQTGTSDVRERGSSEMAAAHGEVAGSFHLADAQALMDAWNAQILTWWTEFNFADARPPRLVIDMDGETDLKALIEIVKMLVELGLPVPLSWLYETFGIPQPKDGEAVATAVKSPVGGGSPSFFRRS